MKAVVVSQTGVPKEVFLDTDYILVILGLFSFAWIKLFIDGRNSEAIINLLLIYTGIGSLIHAFYLAFTPRNYIAQLATQGFFASTSEDADAILRFTGIAFPVYNNNFTTEM